MQTSEYKEQFSRSERLLGEDTTEILSKKRVLIVGIGGVGGHAAETLARAGVGQITLIDSDTVALSNLNRQLVALHSTIGRPKVEALKERLTDINPTAEIIPMNIRLTADGEDGVNVGDYDYVIDAIDDVSAKIGLIKRATDSATPIISSMGTGNKLDPTALKVSDISKTSYDPLARVVRTRLKKLGINHLKVVFSDEEARITKEKGEKLPPASVPFVPSVAGIIMAGEAIKDMLNIRISRKAPD